MSNQISPQQRALNFGAFTRKHMQTLGSQTGTANSHLEFEVPKARLLQSINLMCEVTLKKSKSDQTSFNSINDKLSVYDVLRRVGIDYNNGFSPVVASGMDIAVMNMLRVAPETIIPTTYKDKSLCTILDVGNGDNISEYENDEYLTLAESDTLKYYFYLEIPLTLNDRDPSGLVLAQNGQTLINFSVDIASQVMGADVESIKVTPVLTSFSVPTQAEAFPDLSVLKILDSRKETFTGGGSNLVKLPVGQIYRKLIIKLEDEDGKPIDPEDITSNFELLFNTADIPYSVNPQALRLRTVSETGYRLPRGYYAFDFSYQGTPNYGGSRDYIDCERLTTFELRFTTVKSGKITIISEKISRLIASK